MNRWSLPWSKNQTEEQIKATIAGSDRILETLVGHIYDHVEESRVVVVRGIIGGGC